MSLRVPTPMLIIFSVFFFHGCSYLSLPSLPFYRGLNVFGAQELINRADFEQIDLPALLLSVAGVQESQNPATSQAPSAAQSGASGQVSVTIDQALKAFYQGAPNDLELRRNIVQERILAASVQRCEAYKRHLKQFDTEISFSLGALVTALAGAGAIVTPGSTARALAGAAGITSGVRAEFEQQFFARLTIQVLTHGMEVRREAIYKRISENRARPIKEYPVEAAIREALAYHGACSLLSGLEEAALSIERAQDPGLRHLNRLFQENPLLGRLILGDQATIIAAQSDLQALNNDLGRLSILIKDATRELDRLKKEPNAANLKEIKELEEALKKANDTLGAEEKKQQEVLANVNKLATDLGKTSKREDVLRLTGELMLQQAKTRQSSREVDMQVGSLQGRLDRAKEAVSKVKGAGG